VSAAVQLRERHEQCDCLVGNTSDGIVTKHQCRLEIDGLQIGIDCDKCRAFSENERRPDFIAIQTVDSTSSPRWLVVEIKGVMKLDAREQAEGGLQTILEHDMFRSGIQRARVCFAFKQRDLRQTADRDMLRRPFKLRGKEVPVLVIRCGKTIPKRWQ